MHTPLATLRGARMSCVTVARDNGLTRDHEALLRRVLLDVLRQASRSARVRSPSSPGHTDCLRRWPDERHLDVRIAAVRLPAKQPVVHIVGAERRQRGECRLLQADRYVSAAERSRADSYITHKASLKCVFSSSSTTCSPSSWPSSDAVRARGSADAAQQVCSFFARADGP